jgi:glycosyltransferase involved in cell wall biosynthesis
VNRLKKEWNEPESQLPDRFFRGIDRNWCRAGPFVFRFPIPENGASMSLFLILSFLSFTATLYICLEIIAGLREMGDLHQVAPISGPDLPLVSIIVPACNEEKTLAPALLSLLNQEYENIEIIIINDRSSDGTQEVLQRLQREHPQLHVHHIRELADGWLGKTHALDFGAGRAKGEYLVFTDADVILKKTTISRAVARMRQGRLDHLSLFFKNIAHGWILNSMIIDAGASLMLLFKPWLARDLQSRYFMGVGAFNMVRTQAYRDVGGHRMIRMHPIDDIMLGKILKRSGYRQECLFGYDFVSVRWYDTVSGMIDGLMKNAFALMDFSIAKTLLGAGAVVMLSILPPWGILFAGGLTTRLFFLAAVGLRVFLSLQSCRAMKISLWNVAGVLISPYINCFAALKSAYMTTRNGGICWRGTVYSLQELKRAEPVLSPIYGKD